jgi:hypothetical protein
MDHEAAHGLLEALELYPESLEMESALRDKTHSHGHENREWSESEEERAIRVTSGCISSHSTEQSQRSSFSMVRLSLSLLHM